MSSRSWSVVCAAFFTWGCSVVFDTSELLSGGPGGGGSGATGGEGGNGAAGGQGGAGSAGGEGGNGAAGAGGEGGGMDPCGAGLTFCGGSCVYTLDDSEHCGACDHDCGGGGCLQGACQALELASFPAMHSLLLDEADERVFFVTSNFGENTNVVGAVSKEGGDPELFSTNQPASSYLAMAGTNLYWTTWDQPSLRRLDLSNPLAVEALALSGPGFAVQYFLDEVVFGDYDLGLFSFNAAVGPQGATLGLAHARVRHFLGDLENSSVVFTVGPPASSVKSYYPLTSSIEDLTFASDAWDIVQDEGYYYFSDQAEGTLRRITKPAVGNEPTEPIAFGLGGARGLALDDEYVYVVGSSSVTRVAKAQPFETTFVAVAASGIQIAVDEQFIYWTNVSSGQLMKIAKPL